MAALINQWAHRLDRMRHDNAECQSLFMQMDAPGREPGNLEQIIHQPCQLPDLTLDNAVRPALQRIFIVLKAQQLHSIGDRRQRVAKFVTQHREKFIFTAIQVSQGCGLFQRFYLQQAAFGDVIKAADGASDFAAFIFDRNNVGNHGNARAIGTFNNHLLVAH